MPFVKGFMPTTVKKDRETYARYVTRRNQLIVMIGLAVLVFILLTTFTVLVGVFDSTKHDWFIWTLWIYFAIAGAIGLFKGLVIHKEYKEFRNVIYPRAEKLVDEVDPVAQNISSHVDLQDESKHDQIKLQSLRATPAT